MKLELICHKCGGKRFNHVASRILRRKRKGTEDNLIDVEYGLKFFMIKILN